MTGDARQRAVAELDRQLRSCVHCGLCLSSCPTYIATGDEAESPRGRLLLMESVLGETRESLSRAPLDRCLGCRNCETVCPSGVPYGHLLEITRAVLGPPTHRQGRVLRWMLDTLFRDPRRLAVAAWLGAVLGRRAAKLTPASLRGLLEGLPSASPRWPRVDLPTHGGDVALLMGCAQPVYTPEVLPAVARLVRATGRRPFVPPHQGCCGALSHHYGSTATARDMAEQLVRALDVGVDVVVPSAGCSAHLRHLEDLVGEDHRDAAGRVARRTHDVVPWLASQVGGLRFVAEPRPLRVAYHPPCHHQHAQGIVEDPWVVLAAVDGIEVVRFADEDRCCGSAGSYSLAEPELARAARDQKLAAIAAARPDVLITSNPGCELYLQQGLKLAGKPIPVEHLATFMASRLAEINP